MGDWLTQSSLVEFPYRIPDARVSDRRQFSQFLLGTA